MVYKNYAVNYPGGDEGNGAEKYTLNRAQDRAGTCDKKIDKKIHEPFDPCILIGTTYTSISKLEPIWG